MSDELEKRVRDIIKSNRYATVATSGADGPWATPIAFTVTVDGDLLFYSELTSRHMIDILSNPRGVAGAIFDSSLPSDDVDGLQFVADASIVEGEELAALMEKYFEDSFPDPQVRAHWSRPVEDFRDAAPQRFVRLRVTSVWLPDLTQARVDRRIDVPADVVRRALSH